MLDAEDLHAHLLVRRHDGVLPEDAILLPAEHDLAAEDEQRLERLVGDEERVDAAAAAELGHGHDLLLEPFGERQVLGLVECASAVCTIGKSASWRKVIGESSFWPGDRPSPSSATAPRGHAEEREDSEQGWTHGGLLAVATRERPVRSATRAPPPLDDFDDVR